MSAVQIAVSKSEFPAYASTIELNLRPSPVSVTTPTMIPAPAQVAATFSTDIDPPFKALIKPELKKPRPVRKNSYGMSAVSRRRKLVANATTVAQNTESSGEKPSSMKAMIETSERKWNQ